jgi:fructose-bisphosphate aldolase class II
MVERRAIPMVLHGGTGLSAEQFQDLIARGCAKVNISTALKIAFVDSFREYLESNPGKHDPPSLLKSASDAVRAMAIEHMRIFGSVGKARTAVSR